MKRLILLPILFLSVLGFAQVVMTGPGSYTQNFDGLINTGTVVWADNSTLTNWYNQRLTGTGYSLTSGAGASTAGAVYSFGTGTATDRSLGTLCSGGTGAQASGVQFQNTSGGALGSINVTYTMEQWRNGGNTNAQPLAFYYKVSSSAITSLNPAANSTWIAVPTLNVSTPTNTASAAALDGNLTVNQIMVSGTIPSLTLANGEFLMIKWEDINDTGNDHAVSVDDLTVTWATSCITTSTISPSVCGSYTVPSMDETYTVSGTYHDTIPNAALCDSIITINLTILNPTTSTISPTACGTYTVPSMDETYTVSGTYMDTIPNFQGCDSIITINLTIVGSLTYYQDFDTDGLGNPNVSQTGCSPIMGYVTNSNDCDDTNATIGSGSIWYADTDTDGFGDPLVSQIACTQPMGYVSSSNDCDDSNAAIGAALTYYQDNDMDTYGNPTVSQTTCTQPVGYVLNSLDCNDANANINPGATEIPNNGIDEDCSGADLNTIGTEIGLYEFTANDCVAPVWSATTQPANATFSDYAPTSDLVCAQAANVFNYSGFNTTTVVNTAQYFSFTLTPNNCFGLELNRIIFSHKTSTSGLTPTVHLRSSLDNFAADIATKQLPNSLLKVDTIDLGPAFDNVNGTIEFRWYVTEIGATGSTYRHDNVRVFGNINALVPSTYYADVDGDGFGDAASSVSDCTQPVGYVSDNTDCDDTDANAFPGAVWFADTDSDGLGDANSTLTQCSQPVGYVSDNTDCDDTNANIGTALTYYTDADGDGFGNASATGVVSCTPIVGSVTNNTDCDDATDQVYPGAVEVCDGNDNNCDGNIDEGLTILTYYADADNDGFGNPTVSLTDCTQPNGYVTNNTDCNDANNQMYPNATEIANNGIDENCDGVDGYLSVNTNTFANLAVFPNPGSDYLTLMKEGGFESCTIVLVSVDGKTLPTNTFDTTSNGISISTTELVTGVYFVKISDGVNATTVRWVKK